MEQFILHERLETDSFFVTNLDLCQVRLVNNQYFIWFLLIPRLNNVIHFTDLSSEQHTNLTQEIHQVAKIVQNLFNPERLNIASLGNIVSQMHWHIIARYTTDKAWPNPVWGGHSAVYDNHEKNKIISLFKDALFHQK